MYALPGGRTLGEQLAGDLRQRVDISHADQADADVLAAELVSLLVGRVQACDGRLQGFGKIGADLFAAGAGDVEWQDVGFAAQRDFA